MVRYKFIVIILIASVLFLRCNRDDDQERPSFTFSTENLFLNDTIFLEQGEPFSFNLELQDDQELKSLRVFTSQTSDDIDFSCSLAPALFDNLILSDLNGERTSFQGQVIFSDSISGIFNSTFQVLDGVGNSFQESYKVVLTNGALPQLDSVVFEATLSQCVLPELVPLTVLNATVYAQNLEGIALIRAHWFNEETLLSQQTFSLASSLQIAETIQVNIPELLSTEDLMLKIEVSSTDGISAWASYTVPATN